MKPLKVLLDAIFALKDQLTAAVNPAALLEAVEPLIWELASSDSLVTPEQRSEIQRRVHTTLRDAGLIEKVDL